jgi:hypothetical protein
MSAEDLKAIEDRQIEIEKQFQEFQKAQEQIKQVED